MTPRVPRAVPVRASYRNIQCFSYPTGPVRGPCGTRKGAVRRPYGHARELTQPELAKSLTGVVFCRTGPVRFPHGLFTGCLKSLNPYGAHKLIMHALKLYGPRTRRQNSYGAARDPWVDVRFLFKTACEQPGNSPYGARECDVTEALGGPESRVAGRDCELESRIRLAGLTHESRMWDSNHAPHTKSQVTTNGSFMIFTHRWYSAIRALPAMLTHGRYGPFGRIPSTCGINQFIFHTNRE